MSDPDTNLYRTLGHIEGKVDQLLVAISVNSAATTKNHEDHEVRLRLLEQSKWKIIGGAATVSTLIAVLPIKSIVQRMF